MCEPTLSDTQMNEYIMLDQVIKQVSKLNNSMYHLVNDAIQKFMARHPEMPMPPKYYPASPVCGECGAYNPAGRFIEHDPRCSDYKE